MKFFDDIILESEKMFSDIMFEYVGGDLEKMEKLNEDETKACMAETIGLIYPNLKDTEKIVEFWYDRDMK